MPEWRALGADGTIRLTEARNWIEGIAQMSNDPPLGKKKFLVRVLDVIMDDVFSRIRPLFLPVYLAVWLFDGIKYSILMLGNEYLKSRLGSCGEGVRLNGRMRFYSLSNIHIGNNVHINNNAFLRGEGGITIGDNCHISRNVVIYSANHNYEGNALPYDEQLITKPVHIGDNVWIGMNVMIRPGISIGEGAIIGMGAVIRRDIEPCAIAVTPGCPADRSRDRDRYQDLLKRKKFSGSAGMPRQR